MSVRLEKILTYVIIGAAVLFGGNLVWVYVDRPTPSHEDARALTLAIYNFAIGDSPEPFWRHASVELSDLVDAGLISAKQAKEFKGVEIMMMEAININALQSTMIRVRLVDGREYDMLLDGSIMSRPKKRSNQTSDRTVFPLRRFQAGLIMDGFDNISRKMVRLPASRSSFRWTG